MQGWRCKFAPLKGKGKCEARFNGRGCHISKVAYGKIYTVYTPTRDQRQTQICTSLL